jgi:hypothetical protein
MKFAECAPIVKMKEMFVDTEQCEAKRKYYFIPCIESISAMMMLSLWERNST